MVTDHHVNSSIETSSKQPSPNHSNSGVQSMIYFIARNLVALTTKDTQFPIFCQYHPDLSSCVPWNTKVQFPGFLRSCHGTYTHHQLVFPIMFWSLASDLRICCSTLSTFKTRLPILNKNNEYNFDVESI